MPAADQVHRDVCDGAGVVREIRGDGVAGWCAACDANLVPDAPATEADSGVGTESGSALRLYTPAELALPEPR